MRNLFTLLSLGLFAIQGMSQNCYAFKYFGDTLQAEACEFAQKADQYYQFSKEYQEVYDSTLMICPYYGTAFHAKSVAYLKSGDFLTWKKLIDKAVELEPTEYLGYRAWCRYQFFRDYTGAIQDIERLDTLQEHNIGFSANGDYHLNIAKGLCYKAIGETDTAIEVIKQQLQNPEHSTGKYDLLHLGVLYFEKGDYTMAIQRLTQQAQSYDIAENNYYLASVYLQLKDKAKAKTYLQKAKSLYLEEAKMFDPYTSPMDKVYLSQIELALQDLHH